MNWRREAVAAASALCACLTLRAASGADPVPAAADDRPEEFVVTAKALEDLRLKIKVAENEVYTRFNEINSDDSHDIHCYDRVTTGARVPRRLCLSNAWRTADARIAQLIAAGMQSAGNPPVGGVPATTYGRAAPPGAPVVGYSGGNTALYRSNQLRMEQLVLKELDELANKDPALHEAMLRVGQARQALEAVTNSRAEWTLYRDVSPGDEGLPFGARRLVEVRVGEVAWNHSLTTHTFALGSVTGKIRDLRVRCGKLDKKLAYQEDVDWNIRESWSECALTVNAKRGTSFALYEF